MNIISIYFLFDSLLVVLALSNDIKGPYYAVVDKTFIKVVMAKKL